MIVARAHSFILQARLATSLAAVAGYANVIGFLVCGVVVSHVTGHATHLGRDVANGDWQPVGLLLTLLGAFFIGAFLSGIATEIGRRRGWPSIYVLPAALEIVLLIAFAIGVQLHDPHSVEAGAGLWLISIIASLAMGVQNATITKISSGVVRTTHLTGILTDLGHESAQLTLFRRWLGGSVVAADADHGGPSPQRLGLLLAIFMAFIGGGVLGTLAFGWLPKLSMIPPIFLLGWIIIADIRMPICELQETILADMRLPNTPEESLAFFRAVPQGNALNASAKLPDLGAWIARVSITKRTVIVDLSGANVTGAMAVQSIREMLDRGREQGRKVIVIGLSVAACASINAHSHRTLLDPTNCAADIARALEMLTV